MVAGIAPILIALVSFFLRIFHLGDIKTFIFDEVYYVDGARDLLKFGVEVTGNNPEFVVHPLLSMLEFGVGTKMEPHCDSPGEGHVDDLTVPDVWSTCCLLSWGVCGYFGDFEGGEIYYPNQNIEIAVRPGDLVIHGALADCLHGVKEVTKGTRYVYSNFSLRPEKNPGTFPNYKTPEYYEAIKDLGKWNVPLKENPDIIVMDRLV